MADTGDPSLDITAVASSPEPEKPWVHISSLLSLIELFSNIKVIGNQQILPHPLTDADWESFRARAEQVESFTFSIETEQEAPQIAMSSILQIQAKLGTLPMFPSLRNLQIHVLSPTLVDYCPLLASPSLRSVEVTIATEDALYDQWKERLDYVAEYLASAAPGIETLHINLPSSATLSNRFLSCIVGLEQLQSLELRPNLTWDICSQDSFKTMSQLSSLKRLRIGNILQGPWPPAPRHQISILPILEYLDISGPNGFVYCFVDAIRSSHIRFMSITCTTSSAQKSPRKFAPSSRQKDWTSHVLRLLYKRWSGVLLELILEGTFQHPERLTSLRRLERLQIKGPICIGVLSLGLHPIWYGMTTLSISSPSSTCTMTNVWEIANCAPQLITLVIPGISGGSDVQHGHGIDGQLLDHPLENITIQTEPEGLESRALVQLSFARSLNRIFPHLKSLECESGNGWGIVWEMICVLRDVILDEKKRDAVQVRDIVEKLEKDDL